MKRVILSALLLAGVCVSMSSCNNGDYNATPAGGVNWNPGSGGGGGGNIATTGTDPMSATVGGNAWVAKNGDFMNISGNAMISGNAADNSTITLSMLNYKGVGTYSGNTTAGGSYQAGSLMYASGMTGNITIVVSEDDATHVKGGFYFSGKTLDGTQSINITQGYFNITK